MEEQNKNEALPSKLSREDIHRIINAKVHRIDNEFTQAFEFIKNYEKSVTFFGSARCDENSIHYKQAYDLAKRISKELGYAILTGGGEGIMEAANRGAFESGQPSVGLNIRLPHSQNLNRYTTDSLQLDYFFVRKVALSFAAEAYIFFPGGFGTLDELFDILTLVQTHKIRHIPIILVGCDYWIPLNNFMIKEMLEVHSAIDKSDLGLYKITDNDDEIIEIIRQSEIENLERKLDKKARKKHQKQNRRNL